ncbi:MULTISPECIES: iron uptake transporter permease EfeU [unclassified Mycolicibacterium]|uniref:iron uptake transporter permease EfeU n=1 Tax=unclassified Mycolicibacterium TaxID=2636767 RepID=UPI0013096DE2|nr:MULTISPECIES: iron uptake transporter permease EfeU [unclassified Mycolicibacterium]MUL83243.1 iron permease [Mycolicibacterium sp. CBMA 329]MUL89578.1 iron permease [Mycolicibacterium sp. CBMA 331]MUM02666.1 iron permease [Mycolicibacterium sp. CBMA 334]MUM28693.1 iron permease [Mycolicibacterium sp. CBMA 295]MUM39094.1 iron permease [Mycolicibacterium sp. CBMA 247]
MVLSDAVPNLLIGLREGLEAGLVVSILLAAVHKSPLAGDVRRPTAPVWLGLLGALTVSASFAAVLSSTTSSLGGVGQDIVGGLLSILAVGLVTAMIFWMSRTAANLSGELSGKVSDALMLGAGALALTAFLAVAREGLETTLFFWTAAKAAGESIGPIIGGAVGLVIAVVLCWLLYRRSVRMNLKVFFTRTAVVLIVIAAGILSYGIGDLQTAGWLPGRSWYAFDLSGHISADSWWVTIITGITQLTPRMTVLQVLAWAGYLVIVLPAFLRSSRQASAPAKPAESSEPSTPSSFNRLIARRPLVVAAAVVVVPTVLAAAVIALLPGANDADATRVTVTATSCAADWSTVRPGSQTFTVVNKSGKTGEINLVDADNGVVAEIETLGPATSAPMSATLGSGSYQFTCLLAGQPAVVSQAKQVSGQDIPGAPAPIVRVTEDDLKPAMAAYQGYVDGLLGTLTDQVHRIRTDLGSGNIDAAKADWTAAMLTWNRAGAAYGSFGDYAEAIAGLPHGLAGGVADPDFAGLRRLEYGLWHGQPAAQLIPVADALADEVGKLRANLGDAMPEAADQTKRPHEILEDMLRFQLMGYTNQGAGTEYAETAASVEATRAVLGQFDPLITPRAPKLLGQAGSDLDTLDTVLRATQVGGRWVPLAQVPPEQRSAVNAALGHALETLASVPLVIELPVSR